MTDKVVLFPVRVQYDFEEDAIVREATAIDCSGMPSMTIQSARDDCDINILAKRFGLDKVNLPVIPVDPRFYGDLSDAPEDLRTVLDIVKDAQDKFAALPAEMRARFHNDPAEFHAFVMDPKNDAEAVRMGVLKAPESPPAPPVPPAPISPQPPAS